MGVVVARPTTDQGQPLLIKRLDPASISGALILGNIRIGDDDHLTDRIRRTAIEGGIAAVYRRDAVRGDGQIGAGHERRLSS